MAFGLPNTVKSYSNKPFTNHSDSRILRCYSRADPTANLRIGATQIIFRIALQEPAPLGGYSLAYFLGHLGLDDVPNQAPRSFHKREFVCQAAFKQDANAIVAGYIGCRNQSHILRNAEVSQVCGLCQDEEVSRSWVLYLGELPAKILDKDFLELRVDLNRLFANQLEALVQSGKDFL